MNTCQSIFCRKGWVLVLCLAAYRATWGQPVPVDVEPAPPIAEIPPAAVEAEPAAEEAGPAGPDVAGRPGEAPAPANLSGWWRLRRRR